MSFQDLREELVHQIAGRLGLLQKQALAMTCKMTYKHMSGFSRTILEQLPKKWNRHYFDGDPCAHYYYPLLYRAVREAPAWLHGWEMGTAKTVSRWGMKLTLCWSRPKQANEHWTCFTFYKLVNNRRGWKFTCSARELVSVQAECIGLFT